MRFEVLGSSDEDHVKASIEGIKIVKESGAVVSATADTEKDHVIVDITLSPTTNPKTISDAIRERMAGTSCGLNEIIDVDAKTQAIVPLLKQKDDNFVAMLKAKSRGDI